MTVQAAYQQWNRALVTWATQGVPHDTPVYLSVDDRTIAGLGLGTVADFIAAVRAQVVQGDRVDLTDLGDGETEEPAGVAFLALLVLAANDMVSDEATDAKDFFTHFCRRLGVPGDARPKGMVAEVEESLWQDWNRWLVQQGWIATAVPGEGPRKFVNYPISQALLREADEQKLGRLFHTRGWKSHRSEVWLLVNLAKERNLTQHLQRLLDNRTRHEVLGSEVQAVHRAWLEAGCPEPQKFQRQRPNPTGLGAGLYRTVDRWGNAEYRLYPKEPRHQQWSEITVAGLGRLRWERSGWFYPVGEPLTAADLTEGASWSILNHPWLRQLELPAQDFWVLVSDPENPETQVLASWGAPKLGAYFTLLFRDKLWSDLQKLQQEGLLQWAGDRQRALGDDWWEVRDCQVLAPVWDGLLLQHLELKEVLQPRDRLRIAFGGGLRVPQGRGWLEGALPAVTVYGFQPTVEVRIEDGRTGKRCADLGKRRTQQPGDLPPDLKAGVYRVKAGSGAMACEAVLEVVKWDELGLAHLGGGGSYDHDQDDCPA